MVSLSNHAVSAVSAVNVGFFTRSSAERGTAGVVRRALRFRRPVRWGTLSKIDGALGLSVPALMTWTSSHPGAASVLAFTYG